MGKAVPARRSDGQLPAIRVEPTRLDRLIARISPRTGLRRLEARVRYEMASSIFSSGYTGGRTDRKALQDYRPSAGSADADFLPQQMTLRARSRDLARNSPVGAGAVDTHVITVIGSGLRVQSQVNRDVLGLSDAEAEEWQDRAEMLWKLGSRTLDLTGELTFPALTTLAFRSVLESGDVLAVRRFRERSGELFATRLQLIEADRISNPNGRLNSAELAGGVETDRDGRPIAYHVASVHPGDYLRIAPLRWTRVPVRGRDGTRLAKLLFDHRRPGQRRGVPFLAPVIEPLKQLERLSEAELQAAVVSALFAVFIKTESGDELLDEAPPGEDASSDVDPSNKSRLGDMYVNPGAVIGLDVGEEIQTASPNRPNDAFDPFFRAIVQQIGMALNIPYEVLMKLFQSSYSASRAALLEAWRFIRVRRGWFAADFCQFCYELVMDEAVARGLIEAPGYFDDPIARHAWLGTSWTGDSPGQVKPGEEITAEKLAVDAGFTSAKKATARLFGDDWDAVHRERVREARMRREAGLDVEAVADRQVTEQVAPQDDRDEDNEQEEVA